MNKKKNKPRKPTERDAYLKNDFIERQPIYNEVPGQQETDPMMNMGPPGAQQSLQDAVNQLQPTQSFPLQQVEMSVPMAPPPPAPMAPPMMAQQQFAPPPEMAGLAPSLASFPGMPDIGGPGGSLLQNQRAAPAQYPQMGVPAAPMSMNVTMPAPYGNYPSQSAYMANSGVYAQQVGQMPVQTIQYR